MTKKLYKLLTRAKGNLKQYYKLLVMAEEELDNYDCGLELVRQINPDLISNYEAVNKAMNDWLSMCLRIENVIGYRLV